MLLRGSLSNEHTLAIFCTKVELGCWRVPLTFNETIVSRQGNGTKDQYSFIISLYKIDMVVHVTFITLVIKQLN